MALVSLQQAKDHLRVPLSTTERDVDIQRRVDVAGAIVADYLKSRNDITWDEFTAPKPVQAATLLVLAHYDEHRGDDMHQVDDALWQALGYLLARLRDPALA